MAAILVLGADSQIARELAARAAGVGIPVSAVGRPLVDVADGVAVRSAIALAAPALVVNTAAYTHVDRAETDVDEAFRANATGPDIVARSCGEAGVPLVHLSTDYVFDGRKPTAYTEDDPVAPLSVYGRSKAAGEDAVRRALDRHIIMRTSWVYGAYGSNFLKTILRLALEHDELTMVADQLGCPTATADIADAILAIAARIAAADATWGTYHFVGRGATTWHGFAEEIVDVQAGITGRRPKVVAITTADYPRPARRPANSALDSSRFHQAFGVRAADWRERVRHLVAALAVRPAAGMS
ncbi:MAG: dTDP-4-dehydrorhamnose reductase [Xanthobacteraceae bacterium]|jgi:dTDP-4-dehydrorhamnose reductase